ncbi:hypothetical protein YYE_04021 [Plasmodium vinckei vinckei]|uniref:Uncharacterized protein n=1 Tax=Plasmodium vinckei vinckei TaxID=54757 RepID=A0A081IBD0_PLAVN|nr:hypothetical protein YYE_04021 [Plasmodium vinckei vinckei]
MIKSEQIPIDNINYNLKIEENDDDNKKSKKICELINCNDKNMINYIYKDIIPEGKAYEIPNINNFNNYYNEDDNNYDIDKNKKIIDILDINERAKIQNSMNQFDSNYKIRLEENNDVITELINNQTSERGVFHNIVARSQTNNYKENLNNNKLEISEPPSGSSKNTILAKKTNQKPYPIQKNILNAINKSENNGYEQKITNNKILENISQGSTGILDEKQNDQEVKTNLLSNAKKGCSHIFKGYETDQILNVLNIISKEHIYTKSYYSDNYAEKLEQESNLKLSDLSNYNDLDINNDQIQTKIIENENDSKGNTIADKKTSSNRMPFLKSMSKNDKLIYLTLLKNIDKHTLLSINKNVFFLKRIQQYFYRKYIHIKFPNDLDNYYYFINMDWFNKLKNFLFTDSGEFPGEITNYKLYTNENINIMNFEDITNIENFKSDLKEGKDYICINKYMWRFLYYTFKGGPCIKRNSNNIYDKIVPISNNDIPNNNIIHSLEFQYIDKLFSLFNYSHDSTTNIENVSQSKNQIKTKQYFADSYQDLLMYYKLANEDPNTTFHSSNKRENYFEKQNMDLIKKTPTDNMSPIQSNISNKQLGNPKNNITNKTIVHNASLNSDNQGGPPNIEVANKNNYKGTQRKGSERANNSANQNSRNQNTTNKNTSNQNSTSQNNANQNNGDQNDDDKNRDDQNSDNQSKNNSDTSQSNSNDGSVRKKQVQANSANKNKNGKPKCAVSKVNNPEIGNMKRECSDGNNTKSTSTECNANSSNNPPPKNENYKGHKNIENKMNPQNNTLTSNNNTNQNRMAPQNASSKKNPVVYHSSNGNDIYKSCEEYNNGATSSNGYVTTTETDSKGTPENILKNDLNKKKNQTKSNSSSCTNMSSTNSSSSYNSDNNKPEKNTRKCSSEINKNVSKSNINSAMNHPENKNIQKGKQINNMNKDIPQKNNMITYKPSCSSDSSSYQTKSSNSSNFSIRDQSSSNSNSDDYKTSRKNLMEEDIENEHVSSIVKVEHPAGIINYSTTCYVNVVMQCLSVFRIFIYTLHNYVTGKFKDSNASSDDSNSKNSSIVNKNFFTNSIPFNLFGNNNKNNNEQLLISLSKKLFELSKMHKSPTVIEINRFLNLLNQKYSYLFECNEQQDCHEFLLLVFDYIHNMMKIVDESVDKNNQIDYYLKKEQSIISDQFLGLIEEKITCSKCEYVNCVYQPIYNLSVNFFKKNTENNLNDNLIEYFKKEEVNSTCEKCKSTKMYKCSYVYKQPKILIVHLIRLLEDGSKIDKPIKFDVLNFNIQNVLKKENDNFIEPPKNYDLCGVIVHRGLNSNYGHYICYTKRVHSNGKTVVNKYKKCMMPINLYNIYVLLHQDTYNIS